MTAAPAPQRSEAWQAERRGRVTASMAGAILGLNPYMSRSAAMRVMVREAIGLPREFTGNAATEYGTFHEAGAIIDFQMETGLRVEEAFFVPYEDWLGASPDGYTSDGGLIEIKCPYSQRSLEQPQFRHIEDQPHYAAQVQVQLFVTGRDHCWFHQWSPRAAFTEKVWPDQGWLDDAIPRLRQFHAEFLDELRDNDADYEAPARPEIDSPEARALVEEWDECAIALEMATARKAALLEDMVRLTGERDVLLAGRKLTRVQRQGAISYAKVVKEHLPKLDLEPYRGKPSSFWQLR